MHVHKINIPITKPVCPVVEYLRSVGRHMSQEEGDGIGCQQEHHKDVRPHGQAPLSSAATMSSGGARLQLHSQQQLILFVSCLKFEVLHILVFIYLLIYLLILLLL